MSFRFLEEMRIAMTSLARAGEEASEPATRALVENASTLAATAVLVEQNLALAKELLKREPWQPRPLTHPPTHSLTRPS